MCGSIYDIPMSIVRKFMKPGNVFTYNELIEAIRDAGGILFVGPMISIRDHLERLWVNGNLRGSWRNDMFEVVWFWNCPEHRA